MNGYGVMYLWKTENKNGLGTSLSPKSKQQQDCWRNFEIGCIGYSLPSEGWEKVGNF